VITTNNNAETPVLDIELLYSLWVSPLENIHLVLVVNCDYEIATYCVDVTSCLALVLTVHLWLGLFQESVLKFASILRSALLKF